MYKYQEEVIEELDAACDSIEEMTNEVYRIHIGWRHTNRFDEENIPIYLELNTSNRFVQQTNIDAAYDTYRICEIYNYNRISLNEDIFIELNKLIDKVIEDNKKREKFYEKLNLELKALNKTLRVELE